LQYYPLKYLTKLSETCPQCTILKQVKLPISVTNIHFKLYNEDINHNRDIVNQLYTNKP